MRSFDEASKPVQATMKGETGADVVCPDFFVHIIESPSPDDMFDSRTEGTVLRSALEFAGIPHKYFVAVDERHFRRALDEARPGKAEFGKQPLIHISCHGNSDGIGLSDGTFLSWEQLRPMFSALNEENAGNLGACFSTCKGAGAMFSAFVANRLGFNRPFRWIAGSEEDLPWDDAAIAFVAFYHRLAKGANLDHATVAMRCASGNESFFTFTADQFV